ncbi:hypothetical protein F5888DRAFT_1805850 [Russula emetica]|nr:hypothetical protein F5888DRAFT_1805850 [Russula emetica]
MARSSSYSPVMIEQRPSSHSPPTATVPPSSHSSASASPPPPAPEPEPEPTSPISRLPIELLTQIFTHVPRIEFEESLQATPTAPTSSSSKPTWMAITEVCQHWRAIATNCKDFWSYIPLQTSPYWVEMSLARSYPCPISFSIDFSPTPRRPEWYRNSALSALRALSRARKVHLRGSAAEPNSELWREASRLLDPVLEESSVQGHIPRDDSVTLSGDTFLRRDTTALRSLTLTLCDVYPSSLLFRAPLLSLRLVDCRVESPLEILSLLPQLRTLVLQNTRDTRISPDVSHLPQLQHLELTNVSSVIAFFLRGIIIPSSSSLSITCTDYTDIDEPLDDLTLLNTVTSNISPVFSTYLEGALGDSYKYPLLEIASPTSTAKKTLVLLDTAPDAGTHQLQFSLVWADAPKSIDLFSQMLSIFPTAVRQHIHTLRMRETPILRSADVRSRLLPFAAFHDKARDEAVRGLLAFVMGQGLLPALRQVSLEGVDLKNPDVDMLALVLVDRRRLSTVPGEGKINLSLQNCLMDLDSIRRLRDRLGPDAVGIT